MLNQGIENLINHITEGMQIVSFDWEYLYVNDAAVAQSKLSREQIMGKKVTDLYPGIEVTDLFKTMEFCMNQRQFTMLESNFSFPDGSSNWFEFRIHPVSNGLMILSMDISARKNLEKSKDEYIKNLEKIIDFTSHQVRQPITRIMGITESLKDVEHNEQERQYLTGMLTESAGFLDNVTRELTKTIIGLRQNTMQ